MLDPSDPATDPHPAAAALRRLAIDPLGLGPGTARLLVSPDGALSCIPFGLPDGEREVVHVP